MFKHIYVPKRKKMKDVYIRSWLQKKKCSQKERWLRLIPYGRIYSPLVAKQQKTLNCRKR